MAVHGDEFPRDFGARNLRSRLSLLFPSNLLSRLVGVPRIKPDGGAVRQFQGGPTLL